MEVIKVNYNNAYIKLPNEVVPFSVSYHSENNSIVIRIYDNLDTNDFYENYRLEIYVNGELQDILDKDSNKEIVLENTPLYNEESFEINIKGYYFNNYGNKQEVDRTYTLYNAFVCSERTVCSEFTICNDLS